MRDSTTVLLIGLDAADHRLIDEWSAAGHLPTFRRLQETALRIPTTNPPGIYTGALWPSFATGLSPGRHGRYFTRQLRTGTYRVDRYRPEEIRGEPFWDVLGRSGRRVGLVDPPKLPLARPSRGVHVADWGAHDPEGPPRSQPPELIGEVLARFGRDPVGSCDRARADAEALRTLRDELLMRVRTKTELGTHFLLRGGWDLFLTVFADAHCAGHQLWHVHDATHPGHSPEVARALGDPLRDVYVALDAAVGRLLEVVGPAATTMVFASHGMAAHYDGTFLLDEVLLRLEGAARTPRRIPMLEAARALWRRSPDALRDRVQPLADRFYEGARSQGRARRRCFVVPTNDNCAGIRVNLAGREPRGRVRPGEDYEALCRELESELLALTEARTGRPVVREVLRTRDVFAGPLVNDLPDLLVRWHRDAPIRGVASSRIGRIERAFVGNRTGDHRSGGLLFVRGPGIAPGAGAAASVMDIAPTVAALLGVSLADVDGTVIAEVAGAAPLPRSAECAV